MKLNKAIKLAIECIQAEIKRIAVDANLYDKGIADYDMAKRRSERRKLLLTVIHTLEMLLDYDDWGKPLTSVPIYKGKSNIIVTLPENK